MIQHRFLTALLIPPLGRGDKMMKEEEEEEALYIHVSIHFIFSHRNIIINMWTEINSLSISIYAAYIL
jgi:hypothetical protein